MDHSTLVTWGYLVLIAGIVIVFLGIIGAARSARSLKSQSKAPDDILLKKRMESLENLMRAGSITREEYNRRRTELLVQRYKRAAS